MFGLMTDAGIVRLRMDLGIGIGNFEKIDLEIFEIFFRIIEDFVYNQSRASNCYFSIKRKRF